VKYLLALIAAVWMCGMEAHAVGIHNPDTATRWFDYNASIGVYAASYSTPTASIGARDLVGSAPRDGFHLNIISGSLRGRYEALYGALTLQAGDYARASWVSNTYWLQEAYVGVHINDDIHLEVGAFSSHLGVESMILSENYSGIISLPGFFDPNFYGGVKLRYDVSPTVEIQADIVTSFNGFQLEEGVPAFTSGVTWMLDSSITLFGNVFFSRETFNQDDQSQIYLNAAATIELPDIHILGEFNYAAEVPDGQLTGQGMISGFTGVYYDITSMFTVGARVEFVVDPHGILAGDRFIHDLPFPTFSVGGSTATIAYKPLSWIMAKFDVRYLTTLTSESRIETNPDAHKRTEAVLSVDVTL
jgi:hypothetical protein